MPTAAALFLILALHAIPLTVEEHGGITVQALVDGRPFTFLVDTGSTRSVISGTVLRSCGASLVAKTEVFTAAGTAWRAVARVPSISAGPANATNLLAMVMPDDDLRRAAGPIDGILGQDFLSRQAYAIDYVAQTITFEPVETNGGLELALIPQEGRFLVALPQGRGEILQLVPDSGADAIVIFDGAPLATRRAASGVELVALTGTASARDITIPSLRLGNALLRNVPALEVRGRRGAAHGLLPLSMFRRVLFDAPAGRLVLWP